MVPAYREWESYGSPLGELHKRLEIKVVSDVCRIAFRNGMLKLHSY